MISDRAYACPKCGATVEMTIPVVNRPSHSSQPSQYSVNSGNGNKSNGSLLWVIISLIIVVVALAIVIAMLLNTGTSSSNEYAYEEAASASAPASASVADISVASYEASASVEVVDDIPASNDYICHSEPLSTGGDIGYDAGASYDGKSAAIYNSYLEHDVNQGIKIHVDFATSNLLGRNVVVICRFWFQDGRQINSTDGQYEDANRQVCTTLNVTPPYEESRWSDMQLFIPYSQIKSARDWKHLKCRVEVYYSGHCLATGKYLHFGCWRE